MTTSPADRLGRVLTPAAEVRTEIFTDIGFEAVLFDRRGPNILRLTGSAAAMWSFADGATTVGQAIAELAEIFERPAPDIEQDALDAVRLFDHAELLADSPPATEAEHTHSDTCGHRHGQLELLARAPDP